MFHCLVGAAMGPRIAPHNSSVSDSFEQKDTVSTQIDSASRAKLTAMLEQYYEAMLFEDNAVKCQECDFLIGACNDIKIKTFVASSILKHYINPPLMGEEAVAIYLYEKWFRDGGLKIVDEWDAFEAEMFYTFNKQSMIDSPAPQLTLYDANDASYNIPQKGEASIIFFYDPTCSKCKLIVAGLPKILSQVKFPIYFYAVNAGVQKEEWLEFQSKFEYDNSLVKVYHLWDPEISSNYQIKYGVTTTPKMYFIDPSGTILGRRLELESLKQILQVYEEYYTNKESL